MATPINAEDREHIANLHKWAAQAAARGDMESAKRLQAAANVVFGRAVEKVQGE